MNAKGKVIATDLDGTLFYPKRRITMIPKKNVLFLRRFIDEGGKELLVSGRNLDYLNKVKKKLDRPVDLAGCNGAFIKVEDTFIKQSYMNNQRLLLDLKRMKEMFHFPGIFIMSKEYNFVVPRRVFGLSNRIAFFMYQFYQGVYQEKTTRNDKEYGLIISKSDKNPSASLIKNLKIKEIWPNNNNKIPVALRKLFARQK